MAPFTEFLHVELRASIDDENVSSPEKLAWQQAIGDLASQPGCLGLQWTHRVESPSWHVVKIDWKTPEAYAAPQSHKRFKELITPLSTGKGVISDTAEYEPITASKVVSAAPTIEILTLLIPSSMPSEETLVLEQAAIKVSNSTAPRPNGVKAVAHAWLTGELDHPDSPSGKAKALRFVMAWPSLELHRAIMAEEEFKTNMSPIKKKCLPPVYGREIFHAEFIKANSYPSLDQ